VKPKHVTRHNPDPLPPTFHNYERLTLISFYKSSSVLKVDIRQEVSPQKFCVHLSFLPFHMPSLFASFVFTILSTIGYKMLHCIVSLIPPLPQPLLQIFSWTIHFQTLVIYILLITGKSHSLFITEQDWWIHLILGRMR
jgi:hypothetical protein